MFIFDNDSSWIREIARSFKIERTGKMETAAVDIEQELDKHS